MVFITSIFCLRNCIISLRHFMTVYLLTYLFNYLLWAAADEGLIATDWGGLFACRSHPTVCHCRKCTDSRTMRLGAINSGANRTLLPTFTARRVAPFWRGAYPAIMFYLYHSYRYTCGQEMQSFEDNKHG